MRISGPGCSSSAAGAPPKIPPLTNGAKRAVHASIVAWLFFAGYILGRFADDAMPGYYVLRPMVGAAAIAATLGILAGWHLPKLAPLGAVLAAALVAFWSFWSPWWIPAVFIAAGWLLIRQVQRLRRRTLLTVPPKVARTASLFALIFFVVGAVRATTGGLVELPAPAIPIDSQQRGPNFYLVLVDGYPREDTLTQQLGIDISEFLDALSARGFDIYNKAEADRIWTQLTLLAMLNGTAEGVPTRSGSGPDKQFLRQRLSEASLPDLVQRAGYEYVLIDAPVGWVTFNGGTHYQNGGLNTYEERLLGESLLGPAIALLWPTLPTDSLRDHVAASLDDLAALADPRTHRLIVAHLLVPHLPFLWDADGEPVPVPPTWPRLSLYESVTETLGMPVSEYAQGMGAQLLALNGLLLATVDRILEQDPRAVIVVFGDHGARYSIAQRQTEWRRPFLAARTPGHPGLFLQEPSPTVILRELVDAYLIAQGG